MRKVCTMILALILVGILCVPVLAAESSSLTFVQTQDQSDEIVFTVSISTGAVTAVAVTPNYSVNDFALVSGQWLVDGLVDDFSKETGDGVIALAQAGNVNGQVFSFTLKKKLQTADAMSVSCGVILLDAQNQRIELTAKVQQEDKACDHSYGKYIADSAEHKRVCTKCGSVQLFQHIWDEGKLTQAPTQTETGARTYNCTVCGYSKDAVIPVLSGEDVTAPTQETVSRGEIATGDAGQESATENVDDQDVILIATNPSEEPKLVIGNGAGGIAVIAAVILAAVLVMVLIVRKKRHN